MTPEQEALVTEHRAYALAIGRSIARRGPSNCWDGDFDSAALEGLVQAARSFDPERGTKFASWMFQRVRGSVRDEMRRVLFWGRRGELTYRPKPLDPAPDIAVSPDVTDTYGDTDGARVAEIIDLVEHRRRRGRPGAVDRRWVAEQVWVHGRTLAAVGAEVGVTESRVSQIMTSVKAELAEKLTRQAA